MLGRQILMPYTRPTESEALGAGPCKLYLIKQVVQVSLGVAGLVNSAPLSSCDIGGARGTPAIQTALCTPVNTEVQ